MDKKLKAALKQSFTPPPAQHRDQFITSIPYPKATYLEVLLSQIAFIRKRVWLSFILCVCFGFFYTQYMRLPESMVAGVSAILPFFSLCMITEIYKSTVYRMEETELACKYNLPKITLMRIGILGMVSFTLLVLFVIIVGKSDFGMLRNTVYISAPYLLSSYLSLLIISKFRSKETIYVCAVISGAVSIFMVITSTSYQLIYHADFTFIWVILFVVLTGLLFFSLTRFKKSQEELQWNLL